GRLLALLGLCRRADLRSRHRGGDRLDPAGPRRRRWRPGGRARRARSARPGRSKEGGSMSTDIVDTERDAEDEPSGATPVTPPAAGKVPHLSPTERAARGRSARAEMPRARHSELEPPDRDPVALLDADSSTRVPELVPIRFGRMLVSPFTFYRGAAALMSHDLGATPRAGLNAQLCGDAHLSNFGGFASPSRDLIFDLNDFDETLPGPFEWDVKRLAASFEIAGRHRGFTDKERRAAVLASVRSYRESMRTFATMTNLDLWYSRLSVEDLLETVRRERGKLDAKAAERASE